MMTIRPSIYLYVFVIQILITQKIFTQPEIKFYTWLMMVTKCWYQYSKNHNIILQTLKWQTGKIVPLNFH